MINNGTDYYQVLGVDQGADVRQIKDAYRKMALRFHPDRNRDNAAAAEQMKAVNEAYAVLSDPAKRRRYDQMRQQFGADAYSRFRNDFSDQDIFSGSDIHSIFEEVARSRAELERLRLEREHARELERLHRERSEFFAQLAHELKVVLTPLGGYVDMLLGGQLGGVSEEQREVLDAMGLCLQRLRLLAEGLSELARWERGRLSLNLERLELGSLLRECVERFRLMAREGGVELRLRLPPRPLYLRADRLRLSMAVNNLIHNALRFTPAGGWVAVEGGQRGHQVEVAVSDNGVGISEEDRRAIAEGRKGGLGLAIVQAIAEAHGGQLRVQSAPGQGTQVSLFLPGDER